MAITNAKTITYTIDIQDTGFAKVQSSAGKLNFAFKDLGQAIDAISKNVNRHTESHGRTVNVMNAEISGLEQLRDSYGKSNKLYRQVQSRINEVIAEKKELTDVSSNEVKQEKTLLQQISALNDGRKRTVDVIQQEISLRRQMQSSTSTNRKEFLKEEIEIKKLERGLNSIAKSQSRVIKSSVKMGTATKSLNKKLGNTSSATGTASGAVVELGRTVSDSNYGFPAMANNVQQFATQMSFLVQESKGVKGAFKQLGKAMTGAGGVLLLISVAISLFERMALKARETKEEVKDLNKEFAKSQGTIETFEVFAKVLNDSVEGSDEYKLALNRLKKQGFDPLKGSIEDFLEVKRAERDLDIEQQGLKEKQLEALTEEVRLKGEIEKQQSKLDKGFKDRFFRGRVVTSEQQADVVKKELLSLNEQFNLNRITVEGVNAQIRDSFIKTTKELEGNPFIDLFLGKEGKDDGKGVKKPKVSPVSEIILFDEKSAMAQLDAMAEVFDIEIGMVEKKEIELQRINETSLAEEQRLAKSRTFIQEKTRQDRLNTLDALSAASDAASQLFEQGTVEQKAFGIASATIDTYIAANAILKDPALTGNPAARFAGAAAAILTGLANVQQILKVDTSGESISGNPSSSSLIQPPDFNIVGASQQSQLAQTIAQSEQQPIQAYVVADDITTAQQLENNIIQGASLG